MKNLIQKYNSRIVIMGFFIFFIHGAQLFNNCIGIDTEDIINLNNGIYSAWKNTGRYGLVYLKKILNMDLYNPYFSGLMTLLLFITAVALFLLLLDYVGKVEINKGIWLAVGAIWISHPQVTEQFYFSLQSTEVMFGMCFVFLALFGIIKYLDANEKSRIKWVYLGISGLFTIAAFSLYQAFVPFFIFGSVAVITLRTLSLLENKTKGIAKLLASVIPFMGVFFVAFLSNMLITKLFFGESSYLTNQILWGKYSISQIMKNMIGHVLQMHFGLSFFYYSIFYGVLVFFVILLTLAYLRKNPCSAIQKLIYILYLLALWITPYLMTLICGGAPVIRSQFILPVIAAYMVYLCACYLKLLKIGTKERKAGWLSFFALIATAAIMIWDQSQLSLRMYYTEKCCYEQDKILAFQIMEKIDGLLVETEDNLPVVIIGTKPFLGNNVSLTGETLGRSFFEHDALANPTYYHSTRRALGFMKTLGGDYMQVTMDQMEQAYDYSEYMSVWPAEGSVERFDDMIVVHLSETER